MVVVDGEGMLLLGGGGYPSIRNVKELLRRIRTDDRYEHLAKRSKVAQKCLDKLAEE